MILRVDRPHSIARSTGAAPQTERILRFALSAFCIVVASITVRSVEVRAQSAPPSVRAKSGWTYELANRVATPKGALVLMPGFGGSFAD